MRRRRLRAVLALGALLLAAGACDPGDDTPAHEAPGEGEPPPEEPEPGPGPDGEAAPEPDDGPDDAGEEPGPDQPEEPVEVETSVVATGLEVPWAVTFTTDDRVFVTERDRGVVSELHEDGSTEEVTTLDVDPAGEGGLLGLAASPDFAADSLLYAYHTASGDNRVVRFPADDAGDGGGGEEILTGIPRDVNHNGGRIAFGPDDQLYVATGDAGEGSLAQDPDSLAGKILRLTPDGDVPDDNPDEGSPVYALGLRNVQGLAWDGGGRLYANEFGPDIDDEVNLIEPGGNYGWPEVTGEAGVEGFVDPVVVRQPEEASWSGAATLRDGAIPQWEGDLFSAALRGERLWRFELADDGTVADEEELLAGEYGRLRHVEQAPDGSLWVLTSNRDGRGDPADEDDRIIRLGPAGAAGGG